MGSRCAADGEESLFDFPVVLFGADGEFQVFFGDGVPILEGRSGVGGGLGGREGGGGQTKTYLVDHHDSQQIAECSEE